MAESLGFLGTIDAGNVRLNRAALDDMMSCLRALGPTLSVGRVVERETISLLWTIVSFSRVWSATDFEGRLDVRARWSPQEATALQRRVDAISYAVMIFIDTNDEDEAFAEYNCLVEQE